MTVDTTCHAILIRDLNSGLHRLDAFYQQITQAPSAVRYSLDLKQINFLQSYDLLALTAGVRYLYQQCHLPVRLTNLNERTLLYLERMDFFLTCKEWIELAVDLPENKWDRNPDSGNLLELTPITSTADIMAITARTARICQPLQLPNLPQILQTLSELSSNAWEHSGEREGYALIQRYFNQQFREKVVCVAIGDMGRGIRGSLVERHGEFGEQPADYLLAALSGKSSRMTGRGGLGLQTIETTVAQEGGYLWIKSDLAAIYSRGPKQRRISQPLTPFPGTQVVVELRSA
ncbi:MAG: hypothetical protein BroJett011_41660 [Chloroflexota bacterium]|nr:MAG: hypothetical protein BroJett011_41660 [Chloroflexota bacterium]